MSRDRRYSCRGSLVRSYREKQEGSESDAGVESAKLSSSARYQRRKRQKNARKKLETLAHARVRFHQKLWSGTRRVQPSLPGTAPE